jgi:phage terminase large subunit GpA-like protein
MTLQEKREETAGGTWQVFCPHCGEFTQLQIHEPVLCPKCERLDIDTFPGDFS